MTRSGRLVAVGWRVEAREIERRVAEWVVARRMTGEGQVMDHYARLKQMSTEAWIGLDREAALWALNAIERLRTEAVFLVNQIDDLHAKNQRLEWELRRAERLAREGSR